jgi:hypothetical protein
VAFFSPPLFKWVEPEAYQRRNFLIKGWPKGLTLVSNHLSVYETQITRADGRSIIGVPFDKIKECAVTAQELDGERFFVLTFTPTKTHIWIFPCNFLKETAVSDLELLEQIIGLLRKHGVAVVDLRES